MKRTRLKHAHSMEIARRDLLALYDRLAEFSDQCAFLCDAFSAIPMCEESIDPATARGAGISARWLKGEIRQIASDLKKIHDQIRLKSISS